MKVACLQFSPQVGDVENNLNRADSVLSKADPDDLEDLDLLVLPELAFTGYDFKSLRHITPFLEPSGSGISSLWARTTALKYNTTVIVGYPEKVDVTPKWPTSPEYYNSAIIVDPDGQTIGNYRKSFLYRTDETWALEGRDGFFLGDIPGLGQTAIGICMDLNPYRFEAPWHAFEFAFHILSVQANLVVISMAWSTHEDARMFSRMPAEPDMETLTYWVQRLEPLIRAENEEETIVVFCNRTGSEGNVVYAGTSAVLSIKEGEVAVYGILGRGVKDLLVVDTDAAPFAKLIYRPEADVIEAGANVAPAQNAIPTHANSRTSDDTDGVRKPTPTPSTTTKAGKQKMPTIEIPESPYRRLPATNHSAPIEKSPIVATPTAPSPTPFSLRPRVDVPTKEHVDTPHPHHETAHGYQHRLGEYPSSLQPNPVTSTPISGLSSEKYFWLPPQPILKSPLEANFPIRPPVSPTVLISLVKLPGNNQDTMKTLPDPGRAFSPEASQSHSSSTDDKIPDHHERAQSRATTENKVSDSAPPPRPSSPKSRNASRTGRPLERSLSEAQQPDLSFMIESLEELHGRPGSAIDDQPDYDQKTRQGRPHTPKARPASRTGRSHFTPQPLDGSMVNGSRSTTSLASSPAVFSNNRARSHSEISMGNRSSSRNTGDYGTIRPCPRAGARSRNRSITSPNADRGHSRHRPDGATKPNSNHTAHIEPDETRTLVWSELSKIVKEVLERPSSRGISRGRQRVAGRSASVDVQPGTHNAPRIDQRVASQDHHARIGSRPAKSAVSRNKADGYSEGQKSAYNPDDEIVAEIIFHDRGCPTHSQRQTPGIGNPTPSQATNPSSPPSVHRNRSRQSQERTSSLGQRHDMPHPPRKPSFSRTRPRDETNNPNAPPPTNTVSHSSPSKSCPTLGRAPPRTIVSPNGSPATPSSRPFEPTTPKAMKLDRDSGTTTATCVSEPAGSGGFAYLESLQNDPIGTEPHRPRSAVW